MVAAAVVLAGCQPASPAPSRHPRPLTWTWQELTPPFDRGAKGVAYDPTREALWILTRPDAGSLAPVVLQRFDLRTKAVVAASVSLSSDRWWKGNIEVDAEGKVWLGWGQTLARYDPATDTVASWSLPPHSRGVWSTDGNMVAMHLASDGNVWVAVEPIAVLFGFNIASHQWVGEIPLPLNATIWSRISEPSPGTLLVNGSPTQNMEGPPLMARVDLETDAVVQLPIAVREYAILNSHELVFVDASGAVSKFDLSTGHAALVAEDVPVGYPASMVFDAAGHMWFFAEGFRSLGLGRLDLVSGALNTYPFPYIDRPGAHLPNDCPPAVFDCIPSSAVMDPDVQAVEVDAASRVWVITRVSGVPPGLGAPVAMYELSLRP